MDQNLLCNAPICTKELGVLSPEGLWKMMGWKNPCNLGTDTGPHNKEPSRYARCLTEAICVQTSE